MYRGEVTYFVSGFEGGRVINFVSWITGGAFNLFTNPPTPHTLGMLPNCVMKLPTYLLKYI